MTKIITFATDVFDDKLITKRAADNKISQYIQDKLFKKINILRKKYNFPLLKI